MSEKLNPYLKKDMTRDEIDAAIKYHRDHNLPGWEPYSGEESYEEYEARMKAKNPAPQPEPQGDDLDLAKYEGHTPGPWRVDPRAILNVTGIRLHGGSRQESGVASCGGFSSNTDSEKVQEESEANARLIADTPALLAEVKRNRAELATLRQQVGEMREGLESWQSAFNDIFSQCGVRLNDVYGRKIETSKLKAAQKNTIAILARNPKQEDPHAPTPD